MENDAKTRTWLNFCHTDRCVDELAAHGSRKGAYGVFCRGVYASSSVRFKTSNRPKVNNVAGLSGLEVCEKMNIWKGGFERRGTFEEKLGHGNQTKDVGGEHALNVLAFDVADMFDTQYESGIVDLIISEQGRALSTWSWLTKNVDITEVSRDLVPECGDLSLIRNI